jgi:DNA-binding transcriptional ArsR family regulator
MPRNRQIIQLSKQEQSSLTKILSSGKSTARGQTRARILDLLHRREHPQSYERYRRKGKLPEQSVFEEFVANELQKKFLGTPSSMSIKVAYAQKSHLYLTGIIQKDAEKDYVEGDIVWNAKNKIFQGHLKNRSLVLCN